MKKKHFQTLVVLLRPVFLNSYNFFPLYFNFLDIQDMRCQAVKYKIYTGSLYCRLRREVCPHRLEIKQNALYWGLLLISASTIDRYKTFLFILQKPLLKKCPGMDDSPLNANFLILISLCPDVMDLLDFCLFTPSSCQYIGVRKFEAMDQLIC